jgi:MATE family multidrug resistance protein
MIQWAALKRFFMVNRDILIRTLCLIFTFSFFTASSASQNDTILAVNTILLQFFFIMSYLVDGFAFAGEALVGKYVGAKDNVNLKKSIKYLFIWGLLIGLFFTVIYAVGSQPILHILTNNASIIGLAKIYIYWVILIPLLTFPAFIWDGVYIGATAAAPMRNSLLAATLLVFLPAYFIAKPYIGNHGLWLAMMLFMIGRGLFLTLYARRAIYSRIIS